MIPRLSHVDWGGDGPPLVFLHGGSAHARWWDFVARHLAGEYRVLALDLRGHGDSEWSPQGEYSLADYAADVGRFIRSLGLERPALVGHSLGSFVATRFAIEHPREISALAVVDGRATFSASGSRFMKFLRILGPGEYKTLDEAVERFQLLPRETSAAPAVLEHVARLSFRRNESGRWVAKFDRASLASHAPFDFREPLAGLDLPVLFVRGEESRVLSAEAVRKLAASCRRGCFVEIPGAHHHVPLDRPEALAAAIRRFLTN